MCGNQHLDRIAEGYYGALGESVMQRVRSRIDWICDHVSGKTVLDIGCSQGICPILLGRRNIHVTGIDISPEAIQFARNMLSEEPSYVQQNVELCCCDFIKEFHSPKTYDTILMTEILEHLEHPEQMLQKAHQFLSENGTLIITVPFGINPFPDHKQTFYLADIYDMLSHFTAITEIKFWPEWIGFCATIAPQNAQLSLNINLLKELEMHFYNIEVSLRDRLDILLKQKQKAVHDYNTACERLISTQEKHREQADQLRQTITMLQEQVSKTDELLRSKDAAISDLSLRFERLSSEFSQFQVKHKTLEDELMRQNAAYHQKDLQYRKLVKERDNYRLLYKTLSNSKLGRLTLFYWKHRAKYASRVKQWIAKVKKTCKYISQYKFDIVKYMRHFSTYTIHLNKNLPTIGVVVPTHRPNCWLSTCIDSILNQVYPHSKIEVLLVVNGPDHTYFEELVGKYSSFNNIQLLYTSRANASVARNFALTKLHTECVMFVDDDDLLSSKYILSLARHMVPSVSIVFGALTDLNTDTNQVETNTYINQALNLAGKGAKSDWSIVAGALSSLPTKLYRTSLFQENFAPLDESVSNTEDVLFWAENCENIAGTLYVCPFDGRESYIRRLTADSLSRPNKQRLYSFYIDDRLTIIERLSDLLLSADSIDAKSFVLSKIKTQTKVMYDYFSLLSEPEKRKAAQLIQASSSLFLNKGHFAQTHGIAFCHNFSPTVDPSAYVAAKRLSEIGRLANQNIAWTVVCADMQNCRSSDVLFQQFFAQFQYVNQIKLPGRAYFNEKAQFSWGNRAFEQVQDMQVEYIYSRSMWAGSHVAALQYKRQYPHAIWYAEFSDPIHMGDNNRPRNPGDLYSGEDSHFNTFWYDLETDVMKAADHIIFTNSNQMKYMLHYHHEKDLYGSVPNKAIILNHPEINFHYCKLINSCYDIDSTKINIAFFGSFHTVRNSSDFIPFLDDDRIVLHIFSSNFSLIDTLSDMQKSRLRISKPLPYFEFLNLASKMDYLLLNDASFEIPQLNPFLPSKLADYLSVKTRIIALIQEHSPLSKIENCYLIKRKFINSDFIASLTPKST